MTREEAVEVLKERYLTCVGIGLDNHANRVNEAIDMAIEALQAEAVQGEWTYLSGSKGSYMTISCPICGSTFNDVAEWKYNFCPNCGARMKGGAE